MDIIGRAWTCALPMADPWVSEAHALLSLRQGALQLLGLRGRFMVGSKILTEVTLTRGLQIALSRLTTLTVQGVKVPEHLLAL